MGIQPGQASLPSASPTHSYWHSQPSQTLLDHRTTSQLPSSAATVVVGSGITGAFVARELIENGASDVVMLEARQACWGATGRNGGHCQPLLYLTKPHIGRFELGTYHFLQDLVRKETIDCSWESTGGVHAIYSPAVLDLARKVIERLPSDLSSSVHLTTDPEKLKTLKLRGNAIAAIVQDHAAKCWPYKLVSHILEALVRTSSFNLQTTTPVTYIQRCDSSYIVHTDRGQIAAENVVLATNAYTSHLLPSFTGFITPVRGHVSALVPPDGQSLAHTYVWSIQKEGDAGESDDYLVQRPTGELILGGERNAVTDGGVGVSSDDEVDPIVAKRLRTVLSSILKFGDHDTKELEAKYEWSGIMGYSKDASPWVGRVPESLGGRDDGKGNLWVSAGYTGHGMPVAARCGIAVAERILGKMKDVVDVPGEGSSARRESTGSRLWRCRTPWRMSLECYLRTMAHVRQWADVFLNYPAM